MIDWWEELLNSDPNPRPRCTCVWDCKHEWCGCPIHQPKEKP